MAKRFPKDDEAQIFYAIYLTATQSPNDKTFADTLKAAQILEPQFKKHPDHPGVAHYLIHAYDYPPIADKGLNAAKRYAEIAPSAPHALHMPSHIFTRVGAWQDSVATNRRSTAVAHGGQRSRWRAARHGLHGVRRTFSSRATRMRASIARRKRTRLYRHQLLITAAPPMRWLRFRRASLSSADFGRTPCSLSHAQASFRIRRQ